MTVAIMNTLFWCNATTKFLIPVRMPKIRSNWGQIVNLASLSYSEGSIPPFFVVFYKNYVFWDPLKNRIWEWKGWNITLNRVNLMSYTNYREEGGEGIKRFSKKFFSFLVFQKIMKNWKRWPFYKPLKKGVMMNKCFQRSFWIQISIIIPFMKKILKKSFFF